LPAAVVILGVVIAVSAGLRGLVVYAFFVAFVLVVTVAVGGWGPILRRSGERWSDRDRR